jgi:hypothetical protein
LTTYFSGLTPELQPFLAAFDCVLIDLVIVEYCFSYPQLRSDYTRLTELLLQYSRRKRALVRLLEEQVELVRHLLTSQSGQAFIETTFIYLSWAIPMTDSEVITIFHRISPEAGELAIPHDCHGFRCSKGVHAATHH